MVRWQQRAACKGVDPELFFPVDRGMTPEAEAACKVCPVTMECLLAAEGEGYDGQWGIRGGLSESEREAMKQSRVRELVGA